MDALGFLLILMIAFPGWPARVAAEFRIKYRKALKEGMKNG
jgi:hypothetical protein